jgi:large subunit ribosomal protein L5
MQTLQGANYYPMTAPRIRERYEKQVRSAMKKEFGYRSLMAVPRLHKIVVNMGVGEAKDDIKILDTAAGELATIAGQKAKITRSRKAIAAFNVRANIPIGCCVTLRGDRMYEFFDRLVNIALPRVRDFQGLSPRAFDGRGNYTLGLRDQLVFPEVDYTKVDRTMGMNVTVVTTAKTDEEAFYLLHALGMPFRTRKAA